MNGILVDYCQSPSRCFMRFYCLLLTRDSYNINLQCISGVLIVALCKVKSLNIRVAHTRKQIHTRCVQIEYKFNDSFR